MPRAVLYTRVSSEEQLEGYSLSAQAEAGQRFAEQRGWELTFVYEERGRSGKNALRPEFQRMIRDAHAGMFDIIIVHKLDRFSRSVLDMFTYLKDLKEINVSLVSITEDFDFTTPFGKVILAMLASFAEWYLDNLRNEITKGKKERARQGHWNGRLSYGYTTPKKLKAKLWDLGEAFKAGSIAEDEYSRLAGLYEDALDKAEGKVETAAVPCPVNARGVVFAFEQYSTGLYSDGDIAKMLVNAGYRIDGVKGNTIITKDAVEDMLKNRFYLGETSYGRKVPGKKREWMPGIHEPLIDEDLFNSCLQIRQNRAGSIRYHHGALATKRVYPLTTLLVCDHCGTALIGFQQHGKKSVYVDRHQKKNRSCSSVVKSIVADEAERVLDGVLAKVRLPKDWQDKIFDMFKAPDADDYEMIEKQRKSVEERLDRAKKLYVMGDISEDEYQKMKANLVRQLDAMPLPNGMTTFDVKRTAELLDNLPAVLADSTSEEKKALYRALFKRVVVRDGQIRAIEPTPILWTLLLLMSSAGRTGFEPAIRSYPRITA